MKKIFNSYLKEFMFLRNDKLQNNIDIIKEHPIVKNSNIYFVTKIKKIRFDLPSIYIDFNYNIKGKIKLGNKKYKFKYPLNNFYMSMPQIGDYFKTEYNFINTYYHSSNIKLLNNIFMRIKYRKDFKINYQLSDIDGKDLYLHSGLTKKLTNNESDELFIHGDNFIGLLDSTSNIERTNFTGETIYIGKSIDITKRTSTHDKFSKFYSQLKDDEELLFYFMNFDDSNISIDNISNLNNFQFISRTEVDEVQKEDRISLIEASLINYFKPILNKQEKNNNLSETNKVKKFLQHNNFTDIHIELITEGELSKFGNTTIKHSNVHNIKFDINKS